MLKAMQFMTNYKFGVVVLIAFPFTDLKQTKKRPALVLFNSEDNDIVLCRITSQSAQNEFDIIIDDWKTCGLLLPSCVRLQKIVTAEKSNIEKVLGKLSVETKQKIKTGILKLIGKNLQ